MGNTESKARPSKPSSELTPTVVAYAGANLLMVALAIFANYHKGCEGHKSYTAAKAGGYVLNLNFFLVPIPMLAGIRERILESGRHAGVNKLFMDKRSSHIAIAAVIWVGVFIHVAGHGWHDVAMEEAEQQQGPCSQKVYEHWRGWTGILLLVLLGLMSVTAMPCLRKAEGDSFMHKLGGYSLFQNVHKLWPVVYALLSLHGRHMTLGFLACLLLVFAMDWIVLQMQTKEVIAKVKEEYSFTLPEERRQWNASEGISPVCLGVVPGQDAGATATSGAFAQQAHVLEVEMEQPFPVQAGQYVLISADVARGKKEFHPFTVSSFTVSSDRKEKEKMTLHIQVKNGNKTRDWCEALRVYFEKADEPKLRVCGPFTAPAVRAMHSETVMLVGGGIGVTPTMSILSCLDRRSHSSSEDLPKKVYAVSCAPSQEKASFFEEKFKNIALGHARDIVDIKIYITQEKKTTKDVEAVLPNFSINPGRPVWDTIFSQVKGRHKGVVGVFACGPPNLTEAVRKLCKEHNEPNQSATTFTFHQEHF